jgi:hypothetical protein
MYLNMRSYEKIAEAIGRREKEKEQVDTIYGR